ncbi:MAG: hypothetical protein COT17_04265 [Elusimicrobia bacterium CG08_land_8_20_14_0_20_51_18]|nr:MAG: hypothetical protein COT17_04265 [Elusimicrobia bacterium CG08_land_8_20_14_0_20_51_18]
MKIGLSGILFGLVWFLPLYLTMLETDWGKRELVDERDRGPDTVFSWSSAGLGLCFFAAMVLG